MPTSHELSTSQIREALQLSEQIDSLQQRLQALLGGAGSSTPVKVAASESARPAGRTRRKMSPATRAKMRAAQQARWASIRGTPAKSASASPKSESPTKGSKKRGLTPEGRARLAAAMKARWAARKKGAPAPNAAAH